MALGTSPYATDYDRPSRSEYQTDLDAYQCKECGFVYDAESQDPPENASFYWVPHCPYCNSDMTANPTTEDQVAIALDMYRTDDWDSTDKRMAYLNTIQAKARHLHGREVHGCEPE